MNIETKRLRITELTPDMAEYVHLNSLDDDNRRFVPDEVFKTVEAAEKAVASLISYYDQPAKPQVYAILLKESGQQIGHVQAVPIKYGWEVGYHIAKEFTKKGYATEAVQNFLPEIMERLGIAEIHGVCHADNIASKKVLENCGFHLMEQPKTLFQLLCSKLTFMRCWHKLFYILQI